MMNQKSSGIQLNQFVPRDLTSDTLERKAKQAVAIRNWLQWRRATALKTTEGKAKLARYCWKGRARPPFREEMYGLGTELKVPNYFEQ